MELDLKLVSGNCCVLIQTNVGNCTFNVKMKKHCALLGQGARLSDWQSARPLTGIAMDGVECLFVPGAT